MVAIIQRATLLWTPDKRGGERNDKGDNESASY